MEKESQGAISVDKEYSIMDDINNINLFINKLKKNKENNPNALKKKEIAFAISLKSKKVSRNWLQVQMNLAKTLKSIFNNTNQNYRIIIVGHEKPNIKELKHKRVTWLKAHFPSPNGINKYSNDKLRKREIIGKHLRKIGFSGYFMALDADDWIHHRFVELIMLHPHRDALILNKGFMLNLFKNEIWPRSEFYRICGSSVILYFSNNDFPKSLKRKDVRASYFQLAVKPHPKVIDYLKEIKRQYSLMHLPIVVWVVAHGDNNSIMKKRFNHNVYVSAGDYNIAGSKINSSLFDQYRVK